MPLSLPEDGPQVDPPPEPATDWPQPQGAGWDFESVVPDDWHWSTEGVQAYRLQSGWGPRPKAGQ